LSCTALVQDESTLFLRTSDPSKTLLRVSIGFEAQAKLFEIQIFW